MAKGLSLHIGLNYVDPNAYNGWDGELAGCINDANDMQSIANSAGFQTAVFTDDEATASSVVSKISDAASRLDDGDIFLLTYSGHGGQVPDESGTESDNQNETWVLWDRQLLDNELYRLWSRFKKGVRIFVSSDSCHSGTMVRLMLMQQIKNAKSNDKQNFDIKSLKSALDEKVKNYPSPENKTRSNGAGYNGSSNKPKLRFMPIDVGIQDYQNKRSFYRYASDISGPKSGNDIKASLIYISGCQDNQFSYDGEDNGLFTGNLLKVWGSGAFDGSYQEFHSNILAEMPSYQTPNYMKLGEENKAFEEQTPYTLKAPGDEVSDTGGGTGAGPSETRYPSVEGPNEHNRNASPPVFRVNKGSNPYYYLEITSDYNLFSNRDRRNSSNFYATWKDSDVSSRLTQRTFQLPEDAWNRLKSADKLYYRVGTTSSSDVNLWENFMLSTYDDNAQNAPSIRIKSVSEPVPSDGESEATLSGSVGRNGENKNSDVKKVQRLLNRVEDSEGGPDPDLAVDGLIGPKTIGAIEKFQKANGLVKTGRLEPSGSGMLLLETRSKEMMAY